MTIDLVRGEPANPTGFLGSEFSPVDYEWPGTTIASGYLSWALRGAEEAASRSGLGSGSCPGVRMTRGSSMRPALWMTRSTTRLARAGWSAWTTTPSPRPLGPSVRG